MLAMASVRSCLFAILSFVALSVQDTKDPLKDFCRRWGHQTAVVDGKLYVDGGQEAWNPLPANPLNSTNTWLLYSDLNTTTVDNGMPLQYANLTKNSSVPSVSGGILWADQVNKAFYLFGGEFQNSPDDFSFWTYDTVLNQWNATQYTSNVKTIQRPSFGAGTVADDIGRGFYYGGWLSNMSVPGWKGRPIASNNFFSFDMTKGTLLNNTGPDNVGRAEGVMAYLPASDNGLLIYFGGIEDRAQNGSIVGANMSTIHIHDIASGKWYTQVARGSVPAARRRFCAGATWADDHSSYNIYLYGGHGIENITGFDDTYVLSLPSFTWIKLWPDENSNGTNPHGMLSCNVVNRDQMVIIGGWFPASDTCDSTAGWGQHNMNLGYNGAEKSLWDKYDPKLSKYSVPTPVLSAIGGGPTGGATATKPVNWDHPDLSVYFRRVPTTPPRAATRTIPKATGGASSGGGGGSSTKTAAIVGGVLGGLLGLALILGLILFCLHRRKQQIKATTPQEKRLTLRQRLTMKPRYDEPPPQELDGTSPIHEMATPVDGKYRMESRALAPPAQELPGHPHPALRPPTAGSPQSPPEYTSPQALFFKQGIYASTSPPKTAAPFVSPYEREYSNPYPVQQQGISPLYPEKIQSPDQAYPSPAHYSPHQQRNYSYPPPTTTSTSPIQSNPSPVSPQNQPFDPAPLISRTYYPPPPDPATHTSPSSYTHSRFHAASPSTPRSRSGRDRDRDRDRVRRTDDESEDMSTTSGTTESEFMSSKTSTPARFYGDAGRPPAPLVQRPEPLRTTARKSEEREREKSRPRAESKASARSASKGRSGSKGRGGQKRVTEVVYI